MRYAALYMLLALLGALLFLFSLNNLPLVNWQALGEAAQVRSIETQSEMIRLILELYRRGLLTSYLDIRSVASVAASIAAIVAGCIGSIHLLVDKLFFKKFYQPPNYSLALRRAVFWMITALLIYMLAVLNYLQLVVLLSVLIIALILEMVISGMRRKEGQVGAADDTSGQENPQNPQ